LSVSFFAILVSSFSANIHKESVIILLTAGDRCAISLELTSNDFYEQSLFVINFFRKELSDADHMTLRNDRIL